MSGQPETVALLSIMEILNSLPVADLIESSLLVALLIDRVLARINPALGIAGKRYQGTITQAVIDALKDWKLDRGEIELISDRIIQKLNFVEDVPDEDVTEIQ